MRERGRANRATRFLAAGLLVSLLCCAAFYLLLVTQHRTGDIGGPGTPGYTQRLAAYVSWYNARVDYKRGYAFGFLGVLIFGVAGATSLFPTAARRASFVLLNVYFAWTSHLFSDISTVLGSQVSNLISAQDIYIWHSLDLLSITANTQVIADFEALAMFGLLIGLTALARLDQGRRRAVLLGVQAAAGALVILGAEIGVFDYKEFYLHVTDAQILLGFAPWFTNADLLLAGLVALAVSTSMLRSRRFGPPLY